MKSKHLGNRRGRDLMGGGASVFRQDTRAADLVHFEITYDAIPDAQLDAVSDADRARTLEIGQRIIDGEDGARFVGELEELRCRNPGVPTICNYLMCALEDAGDHARSAALLDETVERFPNYFFGFASKVRTLVRQERLDEVETMLRRGSAGVIRLPTQFDPTRSVFHSSEVISFAVMMGEYFAARGDFDAAEAYVRMAALVDEDHPQVKSLESAMLSAVLKQASARLTEPGRMRGMKKK